MKKQNFIIKEHVVQRRNNGVSPQHIVVEGQKMGQKSEEKHRFLTLKSGQKYR